MHLEFIGTPISKSAGNATAEIVQAKMTLDDGTTEIIEGRAIQVRVGDLPPEHRGDQRMLRRNGARTWSMALGKNG